MTPRQHLLQIRRELKESDQVNPIHVINSAFTKQAATEHFAMMRDAPGHGVIATIEDAATFTAKPHMVLRLAR